MTTNPITSTSTTNSISYDDSWPAEMQQEKSSYKKNPINPLQPLLPQILTHQERTSYNYTTVDIATAVKEICKERNIPARYFHEICIPCLESYLVACGSDNLNLEEVNKMQAIILEDISMAAFGRNIFWNHYRLSGDMEDPQH